MVNVVDILGDLVRLNTVSSRSNLELIDFTQDYLASYGIESHIIPGPDGTKANLFATVGPRVQGGIAFSGHTDVVPVDSTQWQTDPFDLAFVNKRLYGRGSCDMKGFLACCLSMVPELVRFPLYTPIHFAFSYDEEVGCLGVRDMITQFGKELPKPKVVWVGEPTMMQLVIAHKSILRADFAIRGHASHSSTPQFGVSAIEIGNQLISKIYDMRKQMEETKDLRFTPPTTGLHVGTIQGGSAANILAQKCQFSLDIRGVPQDDPLSVLHDLQIWAEKTCLADMQKIDSGCSISHTIAAHAPAFEAAPNSPARLFATRIVKGAEESCAPYLTEAGLFEQAGCPAIVCGPGSIEQAHKANEWIDPEQLHKAMYTIRCVIEECRKPDFIL